MIIQYFIILFNTLICQIGDVIDSGFANSLGLEVICIMGIITSIKTLFRAFYMYGDYYFRLKGKKAKSVFYFTIISAVIISVIFYIFAGFIPKIYKIDLQYETLLIQCVRITAITFPFEAISEQLLSYMIYTNQGKLCSITNLIYYIFMIIFDIIAVIIFHSVKLIIIFTGLCLFVYDVVVYRLCGIYKEKYTKGDFKHIIIDGFPYFFNSCICKITVTLINIFATRLGTVNYAILVISRKALEFGQECLAPMQPLSIVSFRGKKLGYKKLINALKSVLIVGSFLFLGVGYMVTFIIKGDLTVSQFIIPFTVTVLTSFPTYTFFMLGHVKIILDERGDLMNKTAFVRLAITFILCTLSLWFDIWPLLMYSTVVDLLVGMYIYKCAERN